MIEGVAFGGNSGGDQYATAIDGRVFRLREAGYIGGACSGLGITVAAGDLREFPGEILAAVEAFGDGGHILGL
jgi:hypothetical protein